MMKLYHAITSVCSLKVRVGLAEIGVEYESEVLNLQAGEQHAPDYLLLNPNGVVPTLVDRDLVLIESSLILEYLDREFNDSKLMPSDRALEAAAREWLLRCIAIHAAINTLTFTTVMRDSVLATKTPDEIEEMLARMPDPLMRLKRKEVFENGLNSVYVGQALTDLKRTFVDMEVALANSDWVSGPSFGIVDIALIAYIDRIERLGFEGLFKPGTAIPEWLGRMQSRASYKEEISDKIGNEIAAKMRGAGHKHWPELERIWTNYA